ncbi:hypothetical protein HY227_01105 [Candidatus Wolfebacteria bacterium]|nr:hypothetical protein [Candidatus Wolfebacteria bacterium]
MNKNIKIIILVVAVLAVAAGGYFVWKKYYKKIEPMKQEESKTLGGQIYDKVENPAQKLPETNPFKQANTNPFDESKTNPYKEVYKNPFQ